MKQPYMPSHPGSFLKSSAMLGRSFAPPTPEMAEHEKAAEAFAKNRERLKAERLAREAGEPPKRKTAGPD